MACSRLSTTNPRSAVLTFALIHHDCLRRGLLGSSGSHEQEDHEAMVEVVLVTFLLCGPITEKHANMQSVVLFATDIL